MRVPHARSENVVNVTHSNLIAGYHAQGSAPGVKWVFLAPDPFALPSSDNNSDSRARFYQRVLLVQGKAHVTCARELFVTLKAVCE